MATLTGDLVIAGGGDVALNTQIESFTIAAPPSITYTLTDSPAADTTGDLIITLTLNGWTAEQGRDYSVSGAVITWSSPDVALEVGERLVAVYQPRLTP